VREGKGEREKERAGRARGESARVMHDAGHEMIRDIDA